jgi:3,5-epimerase/4-reductase
MKNKIIILGNGFVGSNLAKHFSTNKIDHEIYSHDNLNYNHRETFEDFLREKKEEIKAVINCSGYTGVPNVDACESNKDLCWWLNAGCPVKIVETCNQYDVPIIHVGSGCIYSGYDKVYGEEDEPNFGLHLESSSHYSKCKHMFEVMTNGLKRYVFRIRIPYIDESCPKNYFNKLLNYDTLINELNSVTSIKDFNIFVESFLNRLGEMPHGLYNVVHTQPVKAEEIVNILKENGLNNPNWNFIETKDLNTVAKRSNCVLGTDKIKNLGLELPNALDSIERDVKILAKDYDQKS